VRPRYFASFDEWHAWLDENHVRAAELLVGFHKRASGRPSLTWPQSVDGALCFGWIDGVRKRVDDQRYTIRFTPRRERSIWSAINIRRVGELERLGLMREAGRAAFAKRDEKRSKVYSYEREAAAAFTPSETKRLKANAAAWKYFAAKAPWWRKAATHWVVSAKREETRDRRLAALIAESAAGRDIPPLRRRG
jgi:uncharacterized protein YdeI (YjbR/CyaY-like superfamily)